jgi:O-antigen ligase
MFNTFKSKETALNTTSTRLVIWKHSFMIIKNKPILGVGTGDANDELLKTYVGKNEIELKERKFNAHNQFLQTSISLGILGLLALILPFIILFYKSIINQSLINLSFVILVLTNFLFEAMLETQAGVIFISFFLFLGLNYYYRQNENHI